MAPYQIACKCGRDELLFCVISNGTRVVVTCPACVVVVAEFQAIAPVQTMVN